VGAKSKEVVAQLKAMKVKNAADLVEPKAIEPLTYYQYPSTDSHEQSVRKDHS
jgi:hypothetical protein